jgi:hypothetical protein
MDIWQDQREPEITDGRECGAVVVKSSRRLEREDAVWGSPH